jgi:hypothetical protein
VSFQATRPKFVTCSSILSRLANQNAALIDNHHLWGVATQKNLPFQECFRPGRMSVDHFRQKRFRTGPKPLVHPADGRKHCITVYRQVVVRSVSNLVRS